MFRHVCAVLLREFERQVAVRGRPKPSRTGAGRDQEKDEGHVFARRTRRLLANTSRVHETGRRQTVFRDHDPAKHRERRQRRRGGRTGNNRVVVASS